MKSAIRHGQGDLDGRAEHRTIWNGRIEWARWRYYDLLPDGRTMVAVTNRTASRTTGAVQIDVVLNLVRRPEDKLSQRSI